MIKAYRYVIIWALFVLYLCGMNGSNIPKIKFDFVFGIDKLAHFALFGILAWLLIKASIKYHTRYEFKFIIQAVIISAVFGVFIEILQGTIFVNRSFDYEDMIADGIGAVLTIPLGLLLIKKI